eukprot:TRINITY_DN11455_c0_g1_i1.p1 TRINITY_DN11455_c0_g1~~TRINITY_DN11455_c0_g1_i1.p1  ORF type:complete len:441 (-),score=88.61 TRINITY_DN11455_c0_g1_i1:33-1355(-)
MGCEKKEMEVEHFESLLFEGLLMKIFDHLYGLPIEEFVFSSTLVNKRWNRYWKHPLQTFFDGDYNSNLGRFPPTYYTFHIRERVAEKIHKSIGMTRQLARATDQEDERIEFLRTELWFHHWIISIPIQSTILEQLKNDIVNDYKTEIENPDDRSFIVDSVYNADKGLNHYLPKWLSSLDSFKSNVRLIKYLRRICWENHPYLFYRLDPKLRTKALAEEIFNLSPGESIRVIPPDLITEQIATKVVQQNSNLLNSLPYNIVTNQIIEIAAKTREEEEKQNYAKVQLENQKAEQILDALRQGGWPREREISRNGLLLNRLEVGDRSEKICSIAVVQNGCALEHVPDEVITEEMCKAAVRRSGLAVLKHVPGQWRDQFYPSVYEWDWNTRLVDVAGHELNGEVWNAAVIRCVKNWSDIESGKVGVDNKKEVLTRAVFGTTKSK